MPPTGRPLPLERPDAGRRLRPRPGGRPRLFGLTPRLSQTHTLPSSVSAAPRVAKRPGPRFTAGSYPGSFGHKFAERTGPRALPRSVIALPGGVATRAVRPRVTVAVWRHIQRAPSW